jgi:hypothetical protein
MNSAGTAIEANPSTHAIAKYMYAELSKLKEENQILKQCLANISNFRFVGGDVRSGIQEIQSIASEAVSIINKQDSDE